MATVYTKETFQRSLNNLHSNLFYFNEKLIQNFKQRERVCVSEKGVYKEIREKPYILNVIQQSPSVVEWQTTWFFCYK